MGFLCYNTPLSIGEFMSYSAYPNVVYGLLSTTDKLSQTLQLRGCSHPLTDNNAKYCSECGKRTYYDKTISISEIAEVWVSENPPAQDGIISSFRFDFHRMNYDCNEGVLGFAPELNFSGHKFSPVFTPSPEMQEYIEKFCAEYNIKVSKPLTQYYYMYESY